MRAQVSKTRLLHALKAIGPCALRRASLRAFTCVLVRAREDGTFTLSASDLENAFQVAVPALVDKPGAVGLPPRWLEEVLRTLPGDTVTITATERSIATLSAGEEAVSFAGEDPGLVPDLISEWPEPQPEPRPEGVVAFALPGREFCELAEGVVPCASRSDQHPPLRGVLVEVEGRKVSWVAADGYCMAVRSAVPSYTNGSGAFLLPADAVRKLARALRALPPQGQLLVSATAAGAEGVPGHAWFRSGAFTAVVRTMEHRYPDWRQVLASLDSEARAQVAVSRDALLTALRRMSALRVPGNAVNLSAGALLTVSVNDPLAGVSQTSLPLESLNHAAPSAEAVSSSFDVGLLLLGLEALPPGEAKQIVAELPLGCGPSVWYPRGGDGTGAWFLLMPLEWERNR